MDGVDSTTSDTVAKLMKCKISELCAGLPRLKSRWDQVPKYGKRLVSALLSASEVGPCLAGAGAGGRGGNSSLADCKPTDAVLHPQIFYTKNPLPLAANWKRTLDS